MDKPSKCKNCQWYGKPYWSIINPCDSCPKENDYKTIIQIDGVPVVKETLTEGGIKEAMTDKLMFKLTIEQKDKEIARLNNIIKNLDKIFEYYFLGNLKYDQDTVNTIYVKYIKLKELKEEGK